MRGYRRSRFRNNESTISKISMTPLIDTALTLLIIFMITTPMIQNVIKVDLPSSRIDEVENKTQQEIIIYIDKNDNFIFNNKKFELNSLIPAIQKIMKRNKEEIVFVKADKSVNYGKVIDLIDTIKVVGGMKYVALATNRTF